jgi:hypothetical protein
VVTSESGQNTRIRITYLNLLLVDISWQVGNHNLFGRGGYLGCSSSLGTSGGADTRGSPKDLSAPTAATATNRATPATPLGPCRNDLWLRNRNCGYHEVGVAKRDNAEVERTSSRDMSMLDT